MIYYWKSVDQGQSDWIFTFLCRPYNCAGSISMDYFQAYIYSSAIDNLSLFSVHDWSSH